MKLLFDQNLLHQLVTALQQEYPGSQHVRNVGLKDAADIAIWVYAAQHEFVIVTKDADFHQRSFLFGHPPKVVWIRAGNCSTAMIESLLRRRDQEVRTFSADQESAFLILD